MDVLSVALSCPSSEDDPGYMCHPQGDCKAAVDHMKANAACNTFYEKIEISCAALDYSGCLSRSQNLTSPCGVMKEPNCIQAARDILAIQAPDEMKQEVDQMKQDVQKVLNQCDIVLNPFPVVVVVVVTVCVLVVPGVIVAIYFVLSRGKVTDTSLGGADTYNSMDADTATSDTATSDDV